LDNEHIVYIIKCIPLAPRGNNVWTSWV